MVNSVRSQKPMNKVKTSVIEIQVCWMTVQRQILKDPAMCMETAVSEEEGTEKDKAWHCFSA